MNQNPIMKALQDELASESIKRASTFAGYTTPHDADTILSARFLAYKSGHEAASARLLRLLEKAVEMAEYYGNRENWKTKGSRFGKPLTELEHYDSDGADDLGGKKAREFLTTLADASGEIKKDGK